MRRSAFPVLLLIGASFVPAALRAQCAPAVQQLLTDRKYDVARVQVEKQLERSPNDDAAMNCMGRLLLDSGKPGDAVDWLEKAAKTNGKSAQHQLWLGNALGAAAEKASVFKKLSFAGRVRAAYEEAVALDPTLVDARRGLVMVYSLLPGAMGGSMPKAREQAAEILKLNPMRGHLAYGTIAEREKDLSGAEKEFRAAITTMPDSAIPYNATGGFFRRQKRWTDATAMYESALKAKPEGMSVSISHYYLGVIHQENGRRDQAKTEYQAALAANPNNEDAAKALALLKEK